jgi:SAM-dependent methyltransferase
VSRHSPAYRVCSRCGAHFSTRRIAPHAIPLFYSYGGYWHDRQRRKHHPELWSRGALLEQDGRVRHWIACIERHVGGATGVAVEVGCAEGSLLKALRDRGWQVAGIEPDPQVAAEVARRTGLEIRAGVFPGAAAPPCDLFVACDTLEHVPDPAAFLAAVHACLRPGGLLLLQLPLLESDTDDFGELTGKVFDPEEHAFIYSRHAIRTLLESTGFDVVENDSAWQRAHELVVARPAARPVRACRHLANLQEMFSPAWIDFIHELNRFAAPLGLRQVENWSKLWEYPWLWHHGLSAIDWKDCRVLDIGSELSAFPWWLATLGARVTLVETRPEFVSRWAPVARALAAEVDWAIVDDGSLPFPSHTFDVVTSVSVIEHQDDPAVAVAEAGRVLKGGGLFAASFDVCEPSMGMAFPSWNGRALTLRELERCFWQAPAFGSNPPPEWNLEDIPAFLGWHAQTAAHHTYVVGAAVLRKTAEPPAAAHHPAAPRPAVPVEGRLSIVIPMGRPDRVAGTLRAIAGQRTVPERWEIVLVGPGAPAKAAEWPTLPIVPVDLEQNLAAPRMRREGVRRASGDWYLFVDDDVELSEDFLGTLLGWLANDRSDAPSASDAPARERVGAIGPRLPGVPRSYFGRLVDSSNFWSQQGTVPLRPHGQPFLYSAAIAVRAEAYHRAGGFDGQMINGEDVDLTRRIRDVGFALAYEPSLVARHRHGRDTLLTMWRYFWASGDAASYFLRDRGVCCFDWRGVPIRAWRSLQRNRRHQRLQGAALGHRACWVLLNYLIWHASLEWHHQAGLRASAALDELPVRSPSGRLAWRAFRAMRERRGLRGRALYLLALIRRAADPIDWSSSPTRHA